MKILIIEDEPALASSIEMYLKEEGVLVEVVGDFQQAILKSAFYEYDCILVDITLPDGSGLDVIRELKKNQFEAGLVIISARNSIEDKVVGLEIGADDYLAKPFHMSELNARIKALVRRKQHKGNHPSLLQDLSNLSP